MGATTINSLNAAYADYVASPGAGGCLRLYSALRGYATSLVQGFPLSDREDAVQGVVVKLWANLPGSEWTVTN